MDVRNTASGVFRWSVTAMFAALVACGGGGDGGGAPPAPPPPPPAAPAPPPPLPGTVVGAAGGTVTGPSGTQVVIPPGALTTDTRINIEQSALGMPLPPGGYTTHGQVFTFTPHGTTFAIPVTITLPFDPATVPAGRTVAFFKTVDGQTQWDQVIGATFGTNSVTGQVTGFSGFLTMLEPLFRGDPVREWSFSDFRGRRLTFNVVASGRQEGGDVERFQEFGPTFDAGDEHMDHEITRLDGGTVAPDDIADGQVFSTANGSTYGAFAEAPIGDPRLDDSPAGAQTLLRQYQAFIKRSSDARLSFTLTSAFIDLHDENPGFSRGPLLNPACTYPENLVDTLDACQDVLRGQLHLLVRAYTHATSPTSPGRRFFAAGGMAQVIGHRGLIQPRANTTRNSMVPLWTFDDFRTDLGQALTSFRIDFNGPRTFSVDLSGVGLGEEFTLSSTVLVEAWNRQGDNVVQIREAPSAIAAFLRDPLSIDGTTLEFSGLEPIPGPELTEPPDTPVEPAPCVPGPAPDPLAGAIEFDAANYQVGEITDSQVPVLVTRSGGSRGAVTATLTTSDITANAGSDYEALNTSVFFADGDTVPREVLVTITRDLAENEPDETLNLTLSQPGGCAALGARASAVLRITDEGLRPILDTFSVGGTVSGLVGSGLVLQDLHFLPISVVNGPFTMPAPTLSGLPYEVSVLTQPNNPLQVCTVTNGRGTISDANITNVLVSCETPPPSGALDPTFGGTGKVSTAFGGDETAMILQPDGKILMVGGSATNFVLARYDADGSLDESFGSSGTVTTDVAGTADAALAVALQPDRKIVVAGYARVGTSDDFAIVRYDEHGVLDPSFGTQGKVTTDFGGTRDRAYAVVIQPDDHIVVVGESIRPAPGDTDFAVARYDANGVPDSSFDGDGQLTTDVGGGLDLARNVLLQGTEGDILVSGLITLGSSSVLGHTGLVRYAANGALDTDFGAAGIHTLPSFAVGDALALQPDGRILLAGNAAVGGDFHFAVMRLDAKGATDGSFGNQGLATVGFTTLDDFGRALALQPDGRILVAGQSSNLSNPDFAVARLTSNGTLDTSFDTDGKLTIDFFDSFDGGENVLVQPDGKIVLGGFARNATQLQYALARVVP